MFSDVYQIKIKWLMPIYYEDYIIVTNIFT